MSDSPPPAARVLFAFGGREGLERPFDLASTKPADRERLAAAAGPLAAPGASG